MIKKYLIWAVVFNWVFLFSGCAGLQLSRSVDENNVFISNGKPKIKIKVHPSLQYMEQTTDAQTAKSFSGGEASTREKREVFVFDDSENKMKRLVIVVTSLNSSRWFYPKAQMDLSGAVEYGDMTLGGAEYQYTTKVETDDDNAYFVKTLLRRVGAKVNTRFIMIYRERIEGESNKHRLKEFNEAFKNAFEVL